MRKEYDLSNAKRAKDVPHLVKLQAELKGKTRITIMLDNFVIKAFREMAEKEGIGYQTLINRTLRNKLQYEPITEDTLRKVLREEIGNYQK
jgi:predicted DNA binding CopG/RHH family protein